MKHNLVALTLGITLTFCVACGDKGPDASTLNDRGLGRMGKGDVDSAIADFSSAIKKQPDMAIAFKNRGVAYASKADYDRAIQDYDQAIKLKPDLASAYNSRGVVHQAKAEYPAAVADFDKAVSLKPDYAIAIKNRGRTQFYLGKFAEAATDLEKGLATDSANAYVAIWLHMAKLRIGKPDLKQLAAELARTDTVTWPAPVGKFYLGKLTSAQLMAIAPNSDSKAQKDQSCAASFYVAEQLLAANKPADAKPKLEDAKARCPRTWTEYQAATAELERLGAK